MADAIIKVSWRKTATGFVQPGAAEGGIAGSCFTLESGMTLTAADTMAGIFKPNPGFDACRVFVAERSGQVTEIRPDAVETFPAHNTCLIRGFYAGTRYALSRKTGSLDNYSIRGYRAHLAPFTTQLTPARTALEVVLPRLAQAAQGFTRLSPRPYIFEVRATDMTLPGTAGFIVDIHASLGLAARLSSMRMAPPSASACWGCLPTRQRRRRSGRLIYGRSS
jgi:hypothetical protein